MDFDLSKGQELLRKTSREFMKRHFPRKLARELEDDPTGFRADIWKQITDLGWIGLVIPEEHGGVGGRFLDLIVLFQEMGRALFEAPYLSTIVGAELILCGGSDEQKNNLLPKISMGELKLTLSMSELDVDYDLGSITTTASSVENGFVVNGRKLFVPYANIVDYIICVAKTSAIDTTTQEGLSLFLLKSSTPGISWVRLPTALNDKQFEVLFENVHVLPENVIGKVNCGWKILDTVLAKAAVAKCAEMVGVAQQVLEMTIQYAKERVQFNHPIGSFQAVQHHCANMMTYVRTAELITYKAAWTIEKGFPYAKEAARAKAWTNEACRKVSALAHQVHGGIGFSLEHDLHLYTRRSRAWEYAYGDTDWHYGKIAQEL